MDKSQLRKAADISDDVKQKLARLYEHLHAHGMPQQIFLDGLKSAGYLVSASDLDRWVAIAKSNRAISQQQESRTAPRLN